MADGSLIFDTRIDTQGFNNGVKDISNKAKGSTQDALSSLSGLFGGIKGLIAAAGIGIAIKGIQSLTSAIISTTKALAQYGKTAVEAAAEVNASNSQFEQTFGALADNAEAAIDRVAQASGILDTRLRGTATSIYAFAQTSGMDSVPALGMMEEALQVAADSAAYYDRSLEDTSETLKSFLKGNYANDAALGLSATEYTRNAAAMSLYGKKFTELSEAQKQLTLLQMVKDANRLSGAEGQAAREADGWENVIGNLKEAWKQLIAVVGQPVLDVATVAVKRLTSALTFLTDKAREAVAALYKLFGKEMKDTSGISQNIAQSVSNQEDLTDAVEETEQAQIGSLAAFDKLNTIASNKDEDKTTGITPATVASLSTVDVDTDTATSKIEQFAEKIRTTFTNLKKWFKDNFGGIFSGIWDGLKEEASELWTTLKGIFSDIKTLAAPLAAWFNGPFTRLLQTTFSVAGRVLVGLFDSFNKVFSDIWNIAVFPILQDFITIGLPIITEFAAEANETFGVYFDEAKSVFDMLWEDYARPILNFIAELWHDVMESLKKFWDKWGHPIFEALREAIHNAADVFKTAWKTIVKPIFDKIMERIKKLWEERLQPLFDKWLEGVGIFITGALNIYNEAIAPLIKAFIEKLGPIIADTIGNTIDCFFDFIEVVIDVFTGTIGWIAVLINSLRDFKSNWTEGWNSIKDKFSEIWDNIKNKFTDTWDTIKNHFSDTWNSFKEIVKGPLNTIIGYVNTFVDGIESALNSIGSYIGDFDFDIPSWVPEIGGKSFHLDMSSVNLPRIPYLAEGTVVPANYGNFLAMLGDNKREAEVVSPLSTIKQAVLEAMAQNGGGTPKEITLYTYLYPNSAAFHREVVKVVENDNRLRGV